MHAYFRGFHFRQNPRGLTVVFHACGPVHREVFQIAISTVFDIRLTDILNGHNGCRWARCL